jgi:hypothetical protein
VRGGRQQCGSRLAAEQGEEDLGAELAGGAGEPGGAQAAGQGGDVLVRGDHRGRGQVTAGERGSAGVLVPPFDAGFALRLLLPLPGGTRIGGQHRPAGRRAQLRGGLPRRPNQDVSFHGGRVVIVEPGGLLSDGGHPGHIDHPASQSLGGQRQPLQRGRQVQHPPSAAAGQR